MTRFEEFQENYEGAVEHIKHFLVHENKEMNHLANWLYFTRHNPYGIFCADHWASSMSSAEMFANLLSHIHHALLDDGDISFPVVNGNPRIAFVHRHDSNVEKYILTRQEQEWSSNVITWLDNAFQFTEAFDENEAAQLKKHFLRDVRKHGLEFAIKHYESKPEFNNVWIGDLHVPRLS